MHNLSLPVALVPAIAAIVPQFGHVLLTQTTIQAASGSGS